MIPQRETMSPRQIGRWDCNLSISLWIPNTVGRQAFKGQNKQTNKKQMVVCHPSHPQFFTSQEWSCDLDWFWEELGRVSYNYNSIHKGVKTNVFAFVLFFR